MPAALRDNRKIHYTTEGAGPGVVLVPGLGAGARLFGTLPRRFARAGFTCAAVDPVGLEPSGPLPGDEFDFTAAADDLLAVAAALPAPVALVGTSLGGKVALRAAAREPGRVSRLVLLCSAATPSARAVRVYRMFELISSRVDGELQGDLVAPFLFGATFHRTRRGVVDDILRSMRPTAAQREFMQRQARALQRFDGSDDARSCPVPTLCLAGAEDTLTPPDEVEATARLMPDARYRSIDGAGHSLLLESAAAFDAVVAFLREDPAS